MFLSNVKLDAKSLNKLIKGDKIIVKNHDTGYDVSLVVVDKKVYNKLQKALSNGKGSAIDGDKDIEEILLSDIVDGQGIMRKLKKSFNKMGKETEKAFNVVKNDLNKNAGSYVETSKKIIPKNAVKALSNAAIIAGTTYIGQPQLAPGLMQASNLGVNTLYAKDFKKPLNSGWKDALATGAIQTANEGINSAVKGGFKTSAPQIQEAVPIEEGKGVKFLKNKARRSNPDTDVVKPKALKNVPPASGKGFKPITGKGFFPIG